MSDTPVPTAPLLPSVPVDFNALHDALVAGDAPEVAAAKAIASAAGEEFDPGEGLTSTKDELLKIAKKEGVDVPANATKDEIVAAIESKRTAALMGENGLNPPASDPEPSVDDGAAK